MKPVKNGEVLGIPEVSCTGLCYTKCIFRLSLTQWPTGHTYCLKYYLFTSL